jgi:hypothetical protein
MLPSREYLETLSSWCYGNEGHDPATHGAVAWLASLSRWRRRLKTRKTVTPFVTFSGASPETLKRFQARNGSRIVMLFRPQPPTLNILHQQAMMHPATESTTPSGGSTCSSSNCSSSNELVRSLEQELFVLLSHVVVAESDEDKAMHVRRLVGGTRRLEEALGLVAPVFIVSSEDGSFVDGEPEQTEANLPSSLPSTDDGKDEDEEATIAHDSVLGSKKTRVVAVVEIREGRVDDTESTGLSVVVNDHRIGQSSNGDIEVVSAGHGSWRITIPNVTRASDEVEIIEDGAVRQRLISMTKEPSDHGLVLYKGKLTTVDIRRALSHIVDGWNDHFSTTGQPNLTMAVKRFIAIPSDTHPRQNHRNNRSVTRLWRSEIVFHYNCADGGEQIKNDIFAMDGIHFDLVHRTNKDGSQVHGYGCSWINIYIPDSVWLCFRDQFVKTTGLALSEIGVTKDEDQRLHSITATVDEGESSKIYEVMFGQVVTPSSRSPTALKYIGNLHDVYGNSKFNSILTGTGFFSLSVKTIKPTPFEPPAEGGTTVRLEFNLASARFVGAPVGVTVPTGKKAQTRTFL